VPHVRSPSAASMNRMMEHIPRLLLIQAVTDHGSGEDTSATPAEKYRALLKEKQELPDAEGRLLTRRGRSGSIPAGQNGWARILGGESHGP
jgi:hypothetical protein